MSDVVGDGRDDRAVRGALGGGVLGDVVGVPAELVGGLSNIVTDLCDILDVVGVLDLRRFVQSAVLLPGGVFTRGGVGIVVRGRGVGTGFVRGGFLGSVVARSAVGVVRLC